MTIINKLYELASSGDLDAASELKGYLHLQVGDRAKIEYLTNMFPNKLFITASNYLIPFEDQNMVTYLNSIGVGSNGVITENDATAATIVANSANTTVTKFNELRYFTNITESRGGISGNADGWVRFKEWTSLEEIDISNFTSIGHILTSGTGDTFEGCTSLKTVTASNKLGSIGFHAFKGCSNLEEITGLDNTIAVYGNAFQDCPKLDSSCFANVEVLFPVLTYERDITAAFYGDTNITSITLSDSNTWIPYMTFKGSKLRTINIPSSTTYFGESCFENTDLQIDASLISNAQTYKKFCFRGTKITGTFAPTTDVTLEEGCFIQCTSLQGVDLSHITLTEVNTNSFYACSGITTVVLPNTCTILKASAFEQCSALTSINLSNISEFYAACLCNCSSLHITHNDIVNATSIGGRTFAGVASFPDHLVLSNLTSLGDWPWPNCDIVSADFTGSTFTTVKHGLFEGHSRLDHVTMPASLTSFVGWGWFRYCSSLRWIKFLGTTCPSFESGKDETYLGFSATVKIYVPDSAVTTYQTGWPSLSSQIFPMSQFATDFPNG